MIFIQNSNGKIIETDSEFLINLYNSQPERYEVVKDGPLKKEKMEPVEVSKIDDTFIMFEPIEKEDVEESEAIIEDVENDEEIKTSKKKK